MNYCTRCGRWAQIADHLGITCLPCLESWHQEQSAQVAHLVQIAPTPEGSPS